MNKIVPCLKCDADDTMLISEIRKCVSCGEELEIDSPNNFENLRARLRDAESALIGMVEQYCHIQLAAGSDWMPELYGHAFMSAGEGRDPGHLTPAGYLSAPLCGQWCDGNYRMTINVPLANACKRCVGIWRSRYGGEE